MDANVVELTPEQKKRLEAQMKLGVYRALYNKNLLTSAQLDALVRKNLEKI